MEVVEFIDLTEEIFEDPRGLSFYPFQGRVGRSEVLIRNFHLVSIRSGQVRGNHAHPGQVEWLYPFHGAGEFVWETPAGIKQTRRLAGGRHLIRIPPGIAHAMHNPGPDPVYLLAWREPVAEGGSEPDTVPHPVT
jgi:oxalate decarboxylase/phosphoglucose isomerase-like protein (cupin superfamily)